MGPFILGILVGWLAEWLFFTFWVKGESKNGSSDCSELLAELRIKNKEIDSLKASLAEKANETNKTDSYATKITSTKSKQASLVSKNNKAGVSKSEKKAPTKKPIEKASTKKVKATPKKATSKKKTGDDLTKLSGIGPSMAAKMSDLGISSFKNLADMDDDILRDMLEKSGARMNNNKDAMDSWNEQALLADQGDFVGLKKLQDELKK